MSHLTPEVRGIQSNSAPNEPSGNSTPGWASVRECTPTGCRVGPLALSAYAHDGVNTYVFATLA